MRKGKFVSLVAGLLLVFAPLFLTATKSAYAATAPDLGIAGSYAIFGKAGVTNDTGGTTHIWGNVGADDIGNITNLISSQVGGTIIAPAAGVQTAASAAYDTLDLGTQGTPVALDLAGTNTVTPGVYTVGATTLNGTLTLDGAGVYIFRSSSDISTSGAGTMSLINGATACNVFWEIPGSMTIGADAHIEGTIIAQTGLISLGSGATLKGRAFSLISQVTLLLNQITEPVCAAVAETTTTTSTDTSSPAQPPVYVCPTIQTGVTAPMIIDLRRVDATSAFVSWGPYTGTDQFIVQYGPTEGNWLYNTNVTGFSTTLSSLPANQSLWVRVAARNDCQIGEYGPARQLGGTTNLSTTSPGLPNTGYGTGQSAPWGVIAGSMMGLLMIYLARRAQK